MINLNASVVEAATLEWFEALGYVCKKWFANH